jgi:hypothetical protein
MNQDEIATISTEQELIEYTELMFTDIRAALREQKFIDKSIIKPLIFKIPSEDEKPFITSSWMKLFVGLQDNIYDMLDSVLQRELTPEEKKEIELKIYIEKGSNIYAIPLNKIIDLISNGDVSKIIGELKDMPASNILSITIPAVVLFSIYGFLKYKTNEKKVVTDTQLKEKELEMNKISKELDLKNIQDERAKNLEREKLLVEKDIKVLTTISNVLDFKDQAETKIARTIKKMPDVNDFELNGSTITVKDIKDFSKRKKVTKVENEPTQEKIKGLFKTEIISYKNDIPRISIKGTDENGNLKEFKDIGVSSDDITPEMHKVMDLNKPLLWDFTVTYDGPITSYMVKDVLVPKEK